jgi:hypothetical protein
MLVKIEGAWGKRKSAIDDQPLSFGDRQSKIETRKSTNKLKILRPKSGLQDDGARAVADSSSQCTIRKGRGNWQWRIENR